MSDSSIQQALFEGLVFSDEGEPTMVSRVGGKPFYIVPDAGFRRYVEAAEIDRQVLVWLRDQVMSNQDLVTQGTMSLLGKDDLFTKAMIDASISDLDQQLDQLSHQGLPEGVRAWLGMMGFRVVVNVHGEVVEVESPGAADTDDW